MAQLATWVGWGNINKPKEAKLVTFCPFLLPSRSPTVTLKPAVRVKARLQVILNVLKALGAENLQGKTSHL
jgi:hypothetical protein